MLGIKDTPSDFGFYGIIYKAVNRINGKIYIGLTTNSLKKRIMFHKHSVPTTGTRYFPNALKKYGQDSFEWTILDTATSREELDEKEIFYIAQYQSHLRDIGYNLTLGGGGCAGTPETRAKISASHMGKHHTDATKKLIGEKALGRPKSLETRQRLSISHLGHEVTEETRNLIADELRGRKRPDAVYERKIVIQYDLSGNVIKEHVSVHEAARELGVHVMAISNACNGRTKTSKGFIWRFKVEENEPLEEKVIIQMDLEGNELGKFYSFAEATQASGVDGGSISKVCKGKNAVAGGFRWTIRYEKKGPIREKRVWLRNEVKPVLQLDNEGNVLAEFSSIIEASKKCGCNASAISKVCMGQKKYKTCGGFFWCFKNEADRPLVRERDLASRRETAIIQLDKEGNILKEFSSMIKASQECGVFSSNISAVCKGLKKTAGGFIWKYKEEAPKND